MSDEYQGEHVAEETPGFLSDKLYNLLRFLSVIVLPALGAAYFSLSQIWGLPNATEVVGTIVVIDTLAGVLLRTARKSYENSDARFDGEIQVTEHEDGSSLRVLLDPAAVAGKNEVTVKVLDV